MPDPISDTSDGGGIRDNRNNNVASVQETVCLENEVFVILVPRSVIGVGIEDQLGVRHGLNEIKGIHRVNDDVVISADNQRRLLDVPQIREALSGVRAPFADCGNLGWRDLVADRGIAVLSAREVALEEGSASRLTLLRISKEDFQPQVLGRVVGRAKDRRRFWSDVPLAISRVKIARGGPD